MAQADFLADGAQIPSGSAFKSLTSQTVLPDWYTNYAMETLANQRAVANQPYQTFQGPRVAGFNPTQQQGFNTTVGTATGYQPYLSSAGAMTRQASDVNSAAAGQPYFGRATGFDPVGAATPLYNQAAGMSSLSVASPFLGRAAGTVEDVSSYMNPYESAVVDYIGDLGVRNLNEKIMPALEGRYIAAGQFGDVASGKQSSGFLTDTARALRDTSADILGQQAQLRQQGYVNAQSAKAGDLSRMAGLGATAGGFAAGDRAALADIAAGRAALESGQQDFYAGLGGTMAGLAGSDAARRMSGAGQLAEIGGLDQAYGRAAGEAITGVGDRMQTLDQTNLDVAYADFLRQQGYPQEQINNMIATLKGSASAVPTASQEYGLVPTGTPAQYEPSTAAKIAAGLTGLAGVAGLFS